MSTDETLEQLTDFFLSAMRPRVASPHRSAGPRRARKAALLAALAAGALGSATGLARPARAQIVADSTIRATDTTARTLTLGDAARLAAHQSAPAREAQARTAQAGARVRQQLAGFLPNLSGSASVTEYDLNSAAAFRFPSVPGASAFNALLPPAGALFPPLKDYDARGRIADTLFSFGAIQRYRQSQTSRDAAMADAANTAELAATAAADAYLQVQRAEATVRARAADSALAQDLLQIAIQQLAAGTGVQLDVTRARAQRSSARAQLIVARNQLDRTRLDLFRALGLPLDTRLALVDSLGGLPIADSLSAESQALDRAFRERPDLRSADLQLEAARRQVSAIKAERLPAVGAFATDGASAGTLNRVLNTYSWGVGVSLPVFDGFRREGRIEEERAGEHEIELRRRDLRQQAAIEVRGAYLDLASARQQVDATREQRMLTDEEVAEARERFRTGVAGNADVITAELALDAARTQEIDALTNYQTARVALARATGSVSSLP
jgi:outer membrane protein